MNFFLKYFLIFVLLFLLSSLKVNAAEFSLIKNDNSDVLLNQNIQIDINLNSQGEDVAAATAVVFFDDSKLEFISAELKDLLSSKVADGRVSGNKITFSANSVNYFNGNDVYASIIFKPIEVGTADIYFGFNLDSITSNSSISKPGGVNILEKVNDLTVSIIDSSVSRKGIGGLTETSNNNIASSKKVSLPRAGNFELSVFLLFMGSLLIYSGFFFKNKY